MKEQIKFENIKMVPIGELKHNPKNKTLHPYDQELIERLAKIINYQGLRKPIIVSNQSGFIVTGHATLESLKKLGWKEAPVSFQDFTSEDQETAHLIADNSTSAWREIDLAQVNLELPNFDGMNFPDIDLLGIKDFTIDRCEKPDKPKQEKVCPECGAIL